MPRRKAPQAVTPVPMRATAQRIHDLNQVLNNLRGPPPLTIDHLQIENRAGRTIVNAVIKVGEREVSTEIYESANAAEAIQWAIDHHPQTQIRGGAYNVSSPLVLRSGTRVVLEEATVEGEADPLLRIPIPKTFEPKPPEDVRDARVQGLINAIGKEEKKGKKKS